MQRNCGRFSKTPRAVCSVWPTTTVRITPPMSVHLLHIMANRDRAWRRAGHWDCQHFLLNKTKKSIFLSQSCPVIVPPWAFPDLSTWSSMHHNLVGWLVQNPLASMFNPLTARLGFPWKLELIFSRPHYDTLTSKTAKKNHSSGCYGYETLSIYVQGAKKENRCFMPFHHGHFTESRADCVLPWKWLLC